MKQLIKSEFLPFGFKRIFIISLITTVTIAACFSKSDKEHHMKDLDENMIDLRIYHENLGGSLKQNDLDIAEWLANGMDSVLDVMARHFDNNRKLQRPFDYYYKNRLKPNMARLKEEIKNGDINKAIEVYTVLTNKCNGCHTDHDAGKEVLNWAK
jgi:hypothetical protein